MEISTLQIKDKEIDKDTLREILAKQGMVLIPQAAIALLTLHGYVQRYYEIASRTRSYREAWEQTEQEFQEYFKIQRYDSYDSFRCSAIRKITTRKTKSGEIHHT